MNTLDSPFHPNQPLTTKVGAYWGERLGFETRNNNKNKHRGQLILGVLTAGSIGLLAVSCTENEDSEKTTAHCTFSPETTTVAVKPGEGMYDILFQIDGVDYGTCLESAENEVAQLNDGKNIRAPKFDETFIIPQSAEFVSGDN